MIAIAMALALAAHTPTIADVKAVVREHLEDPDSAQFSGIKIELARKGSKNEGKYGFCGYVNAKNSYGGYAGKSFFIGDFEGKVVILDPDLSEPNLC
jgi:hypothetical protein